MSARTREMSEDLRAMREATLRLVSESRRELNKEVHGI
jgi:hypothetical protein